MQDASSPTRDRTYAPCIGSTVITTGTPGKSLKLLHTIGYHPRVTVAYLFLDIFVFVQNQGHRLCFVLSLPL